VLHVPLLGELHFPSALLSISASTWSWSALCSTSCAPWAPRSISNRRRNPMHVSLALLLTAGVLIACGVYLFLERTLTRIVLGFVMLGNGVNLLFIIAAGPLGTPPFEGSDDPDSMTDPLPFAMVLTAI